MSRTPLPIDAILPEIVQTLKRCSALVITAPTGAGKTTRVPPAILDAGLAPSGQIVMLEPRRLAARAAARRMACERNGTLGDEIGYHVRFDRRVGNNTRILVVTDGLLIRMLEADPYLEKVNTVIFDEFHERGLETDLGLAMVRLVQHTVRPDLRIVVMSATVDATAVSSYLGDCPIVASEGRLHPVEIIYDPQPLRASSALAASESAIRLLDQTSGDILVFLPGLREIRKTASHLEQVQKERDLLVLPLYGDLPTEKQDAALLPNPRRKIVLATNVAETSVTVEGVTGVVDTGLARMLSFDPKTGLDRLELTPISRASANQRAGRAGRTQPGVCIRLWSEAGHRQRPEHTAPDIRRVDLAAPILTLLCWGERDLANFPWFEPPPADHQSQALMLLRRLGALDDMRLTALGRTLAQLPIHPRLGCLLAEGNRLGQLDRTALAAAILSERDPFHVSLSEKGNAFADRKQTIASQSDVLERVEALEEFEKKTHSSSPLGPIHRAAAHFVFKARDQFKRLFDSKSKSAPSSHPSNADEAVLRGLLAAFPDRVAKRREPGSPRALMVGGRGVRLAPSSHVTEAEFFVCIEVDDAGSEALIRQASALERDWLAQERVTAVIEVTFDPQTERVIARKRLYYEDLLLEEKPAALTDNAKVSEVLLQAAREKLEHVLPEAASSAGLFLSRLRWLRSWLPELGLPAFTPTELADLLAELAPECRSFADLRKASWLASMQGRLTAKQLQALEREAPEALVVPSGSRIALSYEEDRPPVLAVRIQEIFGLGQTPRLAGGRVPVLLHLLAPSNRPQQITDDLASFWANTYPLIRKELRIRYPKHAWPEDPTTASPEQGPKRRIKLPKS